MIHRLAALDPGNQELESRPLDSQCECQPVPIWGIPQTAHTMLRVAERHFRQLARLNVRCHPAQWGWRIEKQPFLVGRPVHVVDDALND